MKLNHVFWGRFLEIIFVLAIVFYIKFSVSTLWNIEGYLQQTIGIYGFEASMLTGWVYVWYTCSWIIGAIMSLFMFYTGFCIGRLLRLGKIFSTQTQVYLKRLKIIIITMALYSVPQIMLTATFLAPKMNAIPNLKLGICFSIGGFILFYFIIAALASLVRKAIVLQQELDLTV